MAMILPDRVDINDEENNPFWVLSEFYEYFIKHMDEKFHDEITKKFLFYENTLKKDMNNVADTSYSLVAQLRRVPESKEGIVEWTLFDKLFFMDFVETEIMVKTWLKDYADCIVEYELLYTQKFMTECLEMYWMDNAVKTI